MLKLLESIGLLKFCISYIFSLLVSFICFSPWSSIAFICFSNAIPSGENVNVACSIILLGSEGSISSPVRYSCLSVLPDDSDDIFAAAFLMSYCSFSFCNLIFSFQV